MPSRFDKLSLQVLYFSIALGQMTVKNTVKKALIMTPADSVAIVLDDLAAGDTVSISSLQQKTVGECTVPGPVPYGHKIAVKDIARDAHILKNGEAIGAASKPISRGEHVHIHNIVSLLVPPPHAKTSTGRRKS